MRLPCVNTKARKLKIILPVNNSLIDYPVKRYDRAFELVSDVINENFTARKNNTANFH